MNGTGSGFAHVWRRLRSSRLVSGVLANFMTLGSQTIVQLLSVPVLTAAYGVEGFGVWLLLVTIPTYLTMSDLGLGTAATNEMAIRWGRGDRRGVLALFQSVWIGIAAIAVLITAAALALVLATEGKAGFWPAAIFPHRWAIPVLAAYATLFQLSFVAVAGMRGTGHFARGTMIGDGSTFVEGLAMLLIATLTRDMTAAVCAMLAGRVLTTPLMYVALRRVTPQLYVGRAEFSWQELKRLLPSAVGVLAIPGSLALSLQGTSLIVGAMLGPVAVAVFSSVRTASRFALQVAAMVVRAIVPELAAAHGRQDAQATRKYWSLFERGRWLILVPAALGFALLGGVLVDIWSLGRLAAPAALVAIMGLALLPHGSWFLDFFMLTATHNHIPLTRPILSWCLLGLGLTALGIAAAGLIGAALSVLLIDLVLAWRVRRAVRVVLQSAPGDETAAPAHPPRGGTV